MLYFATLFDSNYLSRGLALLDSLRQRSSEAFRLYILALDKQTGNYFDHRVHDLVQIITLEDMERFYPELATARMNRSLIEYYFTLSPYLPLYILENEAEVNRITTMDADLYFFGDPGTIFSSYPDASVMITPHNFSDMTQHLVAYGKYNVSFQSFRRDDNAMACLKDWRQNCLDWCHDQYDQENERFADQKYLDSWSKKFNGIQEITLPGAGMAPWNLQKQDLQIVNDVILVDGKPLIYFHFHHLRTFGNNFAFNGLEHYGAPTWSKAVKRIYHIYLRALKQASVISVDNDRNIIRINAAGTKTLKEKLNDPAGYWFYNQKMIFHVNFHRWVNKLKRPFKNLWQDS